jgi:tight adherence protein B
LSLWQQDPVDLYRQWRLRRRPGDLLDDVLDLLRGVGPGLEAGLTPTRAIDLAATSTLGADRVTAARLAAGTRRRRATGPRRRLLPGTRGRGERASSVHDIDVLVGHLLIATEQARPVSPVWAEWAQRSASAELALVAAAWRLSESTGAPLALAVDRAVCSLLDSRARRGKVAVAVAGPRATVTVLTVLPMTGPLFGMACGIDPSALYFGSPIATASACTGVALVWGGRAWCRRMIRTAVRA